ncbi:hypothetical protein OG401_23850 [Kitasatospora purpeofusca]|uniref:hypothetical protein n=1 Tax=Kitasatospora purpeofusca TaxID=67352 RepID=UPI002252AF58|nr:hypothetical protein [Kitasatospora purpeofusca]MCX4687298.1 hypothetical protein [Kitasatospora purpeofusca]
MAGGLRAPVYVHKGEYDAGDLRASLTDMRGTMVGVVGGTDGFGLGVTPVAGSSARVAVGGGRAWVPLIKSGVRDKRHAFYVDLPAPGVAFDLATASASADRWDVIVVRCTNDADSTTWAEVPLAGYVPGNLAPGWCIDIVRGTDGGPVPAVPFDNYLVLARVKVRKGVTSLTTADVEDLRWATVGQGDSTSMMPVRALKGQTVANAAAEQTNGGLVYSQDEDRLYYKGNSAVRPVAYRPSFMSGCTGKGAGWWGVDDVGQGGLVMWWDGPAVPYDRWGILSYQVRYTAPAGREGWRSVHTFSDDAWVWEGLRSYENSSTIGGKPDVATTQVLIPKNKPLKVQLRMFAQGGWCQLDDWQSNGQLAIFPLE